MANNSQTCCLVAASDFNAAAFRARWQRGCYDYVLAVDGGFAHLEAVGCAPDWVLGDFDSLGYVPAGANVEVHPTHKDESDLDLALARVVEKGFPAVEIYGALGGRLDHTVAALQMCTGYAERGLDVTLVGLESAVKILVGPKAFVIPASGSGTVSVFSASPESRGVTERGMEYSMDSATVTNRTTWGLSNELTDQQASVSVEQGTLYIFYPLET